MAGPTTWQIHWQVPFVSLNGIAYTISIYEWAYSGSIITLKGAPEPFITQEDDSEDIFTPVRRQTGSLRIVLAASESGYLEQLIPSNNTEKLVKLTHIENNATVIDWQGFIQSRIFTQPWSNNAHMIEFPLNGMLASLEHKRVPSSKANMGTTRALGVFTTALEQLGENLMTGLDIIDDCSGAWANVMVDWNAFFSPDTEQEEGYTRQVQYGQSWYAAVEMVCETFGLIAREHGARLVIAQYDNGDGLAIRSMNWATAKSVGSGQSSLPSGTAVDNPEDILSSAQFRGTENQTDYMSGAHSVEVEFSPTNKGDANILTMPEQDFDDEVTAVERKVRPLADNGRLWVQSWEARSNNIEGFSYKCYKNNQYVDANQELCQIVSALGDNNVPYPWVGDDLFSGAWPCIYGVRLKSPASVQMKPGLFVQQIPRMDALETPCYSLHTSGSVSFKTGTYLNISMQQHTITFWPYEGDPSTYDYVNSVYWENNGVTERLVHVFGLRITIGSKVFQGTLTDTQTMQAIIDGDLSNYARGSWVTAHAGMQAIYVGFNDTDIISNTLPNIDMLSYDGGVLIPITEDMSGVLRVEILNQVSRNFEIIEYGENFRSRIIDDFSVSILHAAPPYYSKSAANKYKRNLDNGFKAEVTKNLNLGTINCNQPGPSLLLSPNGGYLKTLIYSPSTPSSTNEARPEKHLLDRMADFYNATRHAYRGQILQGLDLWNKRWQLSNRIFMGIDSLHEWELDRQNARFIEVEEIQTS